VLDDAAIFGWCARSLGATVARVLFRAGNLSAVLGAELADGRSLVIKVRPAEPRIAGCVAVQRHLARSGFPCPEPLAGPDLIGQATADRFMVTAESLIPGDEQLRSDTGAAPFAQLLATLIAMAPLAVDVPPLTPSPPWTAWDHPGRRLWPDKDDRGRDLSQVAGLAWIDVTARQVRERLRTRVAPAMIGHGDWESQNIRWADGKPLAVHDWDSVIAQPETAIVGLASAVWPAAGAPDEAASVGQSADFIANYQASAGRRFSIQETSDAWAAGLWVRLFNAKKDAAEGGGPQLDRLAAEIGERAALADIPLLGLYLGLCRR
jgi:Ser/Thr protein kinase RdoA (MazF antagonist)